MLLLVNCSEVSGYLLLYDTLSQFRQYHVRGLVGSFTPFCATVYVSKQTHTVSDNHCQHV